MSLPAPIRFALLFMFTALTAAVPAYAHIGLVVGEPFGSFGTMLPVGHAGIYLDHVCADSPTHLRPCAPAETGIVLSRYHDLRASNLDWMATPAFTFFYGVDTSIADPAQLPTFVTPSIEAELRESYRQAHLLTIVPDHLDKHNIAHRPPHGDWEEGIGAAFDRRLFVYTFDTTPEQDAAIITLLNTEPNTRRYTLGRNNCADFAARLLAIALPHQGAGVLSRSIIADFNMTTPKHLAHQIDAFGTAHPEAHLRLYEVPQLPGSLRRSRPLRGSSETFIKTKRYLATLLVIQPELLLADWICYEAKGKWTPGRDALLLTPGTLPNSIAFAYSPASTSSSIASDGIGFLAK